MLLDHVSDGEYASSNDGDHDEGDNDEDDEDISTMTIADALTPNKKNEEFIILIGCS